MLAIPAIEHGRELPPPPPAPLRLSLPLADGVVLGAGTTYPFGLALAPDGRRAVATATRDGEVALWLHDVTTGRAEALPGTGSGVLPFWSHDGKRIGYFANGRLHTLDLESGRVEDLADAPSPMGGAWQPSGDIIFAPRLDGGLVRHAVADGTLREWSALDRASGESSHRFPVLTRDGAHVVFHVAADRAGRAGVWLAALDRPGERVRLTGADAHGVIAGDRLLYAVDGSLVAQRLDLAARALAGRPVLVAPSVGVGPEHQLSATAGGDTVMYAEPVSTARELTWVDRLGRSIATIAGPVHAWDVRIAPDASGVAVTRTDPQLGTLDVWIYEGGQPLPRRISPAVDVDDSPVWGPDGNRLAWISGRTTIMTRGRQAMLPEDRVRRLDGRARLRDWSRGGHLLVSLFADGAHEDLYVVDSRGETAPTPYVRSPFNESAAAVSPDGRWLAYTSDESGREEIYVDRFPRPGTRVRLTADGGTDPRWRADGRELVFRRGDALYAIALAADVDALEATATTRLFDAGPDLRAYDMTRDGQRFVLNRPMPGQAPPAVRVVVNWAALATDEARR